MRGRILVVDGKIPTPDQDSGSASTFSYLRILADAGFVVTFAPYNLWKLGHYGAALNDLGIETLTRPQWWSIRNAVAKTAPRCDVVLLYRSQVADRLFKGVRRAAPSAKILFHPVDLSFLRMQRQADLAGDKALAEHARQTRLRELGWVAQADATIVVSSREAELLRGFEPDAVVHHIPILREVPRDRPPGVDLQSRRHFLFLGNFDHTPNVDAMIWFVREVWPLIRTKSFRDRLIIAGARTPREIARLASDQIEVRGYVEDIEALFATCRLSIAPLRFGAGVKGKIVSSLSYGVPVVATAMAIEGMDLEHEQSALIADTPSAMADQIVRLYHDDGLWQRLSSGGYRAFRQRFSLASGGPKVISIVEKLVAAAQANSAR